MKRDLQLKIPFKSLVQFLNPTNAFTHRSILFLLYFPIKPFQNCLILRSISLNNRSIALLGPKDATVYLLKPTSLRAQGYHEPPSMNILGNLPLQVSLTFLRNAFASKPLLPNDTHTANTFSSSISTAPQMKIVTPFIFISFHPLLSIFFSFSQLIPRKVPFLSDTIHGLLRNLHLQTFRLFNNSSLHNIEASLRLSSYCFSFCG